MLIDFEAAARDIAHAQRATSTQDTLLAQINRRDDELRELLSYLQSEAMTSVHDAEAAAYDDAAGKLRKLLDGE